MKFSVNYYKIPLPTLIMLICLYFEGMLQVVKERVTVPVFVMIRPRGGDFMYTEEEVNVMVQDIIALKQAGADGFVFGILNRLGTSYTCTIMILRFQTNKSRQTVQTQIRWLL